MTKIKKRKPARASKSPRKPPRKPPRVPATARVLLRPCPCCGAGPADLDVGVRAAMTYGVACRMCGLTIMRRYPGDWPPGVFVSSASARENLRRLSRWCLLLAVEAWNRRSAAPQSAASVNISLRMGDYP